MTERAREWTIGELARQTGLTVRTLRHYEGIGLLAPADRSEGGHRRYGEDELARLRRIIALRELGFGLEAIGRLLATDDAGALRALTKRRLEQVEVELDVSRRLHRRLLAALDVLERRPGASVDTMIDESEERDMGIELNRIYTGLGDAGDTHLADMSRVRKTDARVEAGGDIDELGAHLGLVLTTEDLPDQIRGWLARAQNDVFDVGADLSAPAGAEPEGRLRIGPAYVEWVEAACDEANAELEPLGSFVMLWGSPAAAHLDVCRAVCRRAERSVLRVEDVNPEVIRYLNRLADLLFILSRRLSGGREVPWRPAAGADAA